MKSVVISRMSGCISRTEPGDKADSRNERYMPSSGESKSIGTRLPAPGTGGAPRPCSLGLLLKISGACRASNVTSYPVNIQNPPHWLDLAIGHFDCNSDSAG